MKLKYLLVIIGLTKTENYYFVSSEEAENFIFKNWSGYEFHNGTLYKLEEISFSSEHIQKMEQSIIDEKIRRTKIEKENQRELAEEDYRKYLKLKERFEGKGNTDVNQD